MSAPNGSGADASFYELVDQIAERLKASQPVDLDDYAQNHPQHAERLRQIWPSMRMLAALGHSREDSASVAPVALETADLSDSVLGDFRIVREIGRGGMGVVYEAEQISLRRRVALKVLPFAAVLDERRLQRFRNEAMAAAQLHHTNIVPVHAVGCERGVHYYAMQYIEGQTLEAVLRQLRPPPDVGDPHATPRTVPAPPAAEPAETVSLANLSTDHAQRSPRYFRTIAELGIQAAEALECAHQEGITHRDIKPSNLILDARGRLWIADFGLARVENETNLTLTGELLGTLRYMSPEQVEADRTALDHRTDLYSLGATLYELLTLQPTFTETHRPTLIRHILETDPRPPRRLDSSIPPELETIVLKSLEKNPADRYRTAQALADDLRRFLNHLPLAARRPTLWERFRKWRRRNQTLVTAATVFLVLASIGASVAAGLVVIERNKTAYEREKLAKEQSLRRERERMQRLHEDATYIILAARAWNESKIGQAEKYLSQCVPMDGEEDNRGVEWHYLSRLCAGVSPPLVRHDCAISTAEFSPDGALLATSGADGVGVWEYPTGKPVRWLRESAVSHTYAHFSPTGRWLAASGNGQLHVWDTTTWTTEKVYSRAYGAKFSPDGKTLGVVGLKSAGDRSPNLVSFFDTSNWEEQWSFEPGPYLFRADFSSDSALLATIHRDGVLRLYDLQERKLLATEGGNAVYGDIAFSPTAPIMVIGRDQRGGLRLRPAHDGSGTPNESPKGDRSVVSVAFTPDGRQLLTASREGVVDLWDVVASGRNLVPAATYRWERNIIRWVRAAPDGQTFVAAGDDGTLRQWSLQNHPGFRRPPDRPTNCSALAFTSQGDKLIVGAPGGVAVYDCESLQRLAWMRELDDGWIVALAVSPDDRYIAGGTHRGQVTVWPISGGDRVTHWSQGEMTSEGSISSLAFAPQQHVLSVLRTPEDLLPLFLDPLTKERFAPPWPSPGHIESLAYSADGRWIAIAREGVLSVWSTASGKFAVENLEGSQPTFSPDHRWLASVGEGGIVRIWRIGEWTEPTFLAARAEVTGLSFSPDGRTLATAEQGTVNLWNVETGQELMTLTDDFQKILDVEFSPDGKYLALAGMHANEIGDLRLYQLRD